MTENPENKKYLKENKCVVRDEEKLCKNVKIDELKSMSMDMLIKVAKWHEDEIVLGWIHNFSKREELDVKVKHALQRALAYNPKSTYEILKNICETTTDTSYLFTADLHNIMVNRFGRVPGGQCGK